MRAPEPTGCAGHYTSFQANSKQGALKCRMRNDDVSAVNLQCIAVRPITKDSRRGAYTVQSHFIRTP